MTLFRPDRTGSLVYSLAGHAHQRPRNEGCTFESTTLCSSTTAQSCINPDRQLNCPIIHHKTGWNPFTRTSPPNSGLTSMGKSTPYHVTSATHCGHTECGSRPTLPFQSDTGGRMVPTPTGYAPGVTNLVPSRGGPICHPMEHKVTQVCLPNSGSQGLESRCNVLSLDRVSSLHVPTEFYVKQSGPKTSHRQTKDNSHSPMVANPTLVAITSEMVSVTSSSTSHVSESSSPTNHGSDMPTLENSATARLVSGTGSAVASARDAEVESRIKAPQRQSTRKMYESRIRIFRQWLNEECANEELSTRIVARFLMKLFQDNKTPSTIEGYRTALSDAYPDYHWSTDYQLTKLIKSFHRDRPKALETTSELGSKTSFTISHGTSL